MDQLLKMDENWKVFEDVKEDLSGFEQQFMPDLYLRPEVHADVIENFRIIKRLISFSYFEYKFYDVATLKSLVTFEMALKLRYHELNAVQWKPGKPLQLLIEWFEKRSYFEVYNPHFLEAIRSIRNFLAHSGEHHFSGPSGRHNIDHVLDLINAVYEDPDLRIKRMELTNELLKVIESFDGKMSCQVGETGYWVYKAWPGFVNNKEGSLELHFYYKPAFEISKPYLKDNKWLAAPIHYFKASQIELQAGMIRLTDSTGTQFILTAITEPDEVNKFEQWKNLYTDFYNSTREFIDNETCMSDTFLTHLRAFHKQ